MTDNWGQQSWGWGNQGSWGRTQEFQVDRKAWSDKYELLDLEIKPHTFKLWKSKARNFPHVEIPPRVEDLGLG